MLFPQVKTKIVSQIRDDLGTEFEDIVDRIEATNSKEEILTVLLDEQMSVSYALTKCTNEEREWFGKQYRTDS